MKVTNTSLQRKMNIAAVMKIIRDYGEISRSEIAIKLSCNKSTVSNIVSHLFSQGILVNIAEGKSGPSGGRKSVKIGINKNYGCILGIDLELNLYRAVLINLAGEIIFSETKDLTLNNSNFEDQILRIINQLIKEVKQFNIPLIGIGVGIPGFIDPKNGIILFSQDFKLVEFNFQKKIAAKFDIPIIIENNANCCAWGILQKRKTKAPRDFLYVLSLLKNEDGIIGAKRFTISVGLGIVINNKVYYGANYASGEFISAFRNHSESQQYAIHYCFSKCDEDLSKLKEFFHEISLNLHMIALVLNPETIFIGGIFNQYRELFENDWNEMIKGKPKFINPINLEFSDFSNAEIEYGAAIIFLESLFSLPEPEETKMLSIDWDFLFNRLNTL